MSVVCVLPHSPPLASLHISSDKLKNTTLSIAFTHSRSKEIGSENVYAFVCVCVRVNASMHVYVISLFRRQLKKKKNPLY